MAYRPIDTYPPEQQEIIRARWREAQRRYRPKYKELQKRCHEHWEEFFLKKREAAQNTADNAHAYRISE